MKRRNVLAAMSFAALLLVAGSDAFAQVITITVDENGNGNLVNPVSGTFTLPSTVAPDAGPGGLPAALTYNLLGPPGLVVGDLLLLEPGTLGVLTDLIRFNPNGTLVFYSDTSDAIDALADKGFPTALYANNITQVEVGPEGMNGATYTPTSTQPGFVAGAAFPVTYVIKSDVTPPPTPEPGSLTLLGTAALTGAVFALARRKRVSV
jgi:hypothetical protein